MRRAAAAARGDSTPAHDLIRAATFEVRVLQLPVMARIGINSDERGGHQPLVIDVKLHLAAAAPVARLAETVDYCQVAAEAEALAAKHVDLVETFAHDLALRCLALGPVHAVDVIVAKPHAMAQGCASVRVRIER